jgi:hypothetical protein
VWKRSKEEEEEEAVVVAVVEREPTAVVVVLRTVERDDDLRQRREIRESDMTDRRRAITNLQKAINHQSSKQNPSVALSEEDDDSDPQADFRYVAVLPLPRPSLTLPGKELGGGYLIKGFNI